jgi:hypothetical protein
VASQERIFRWIQSLGKFRRKVVDKLTGKKYHVNGLNAKK